MDWLLGGRGPLDDQEWAYVRTQHRDRRTDRACRIRAARFASAQAAATVVFFCIFAAASRIFGATPVMNSSWLRIACQRALPP
jgi:hypothetical protein